MELKVIILSSGENHTEEIKFPIKRERCDEDSCWSATNCVVKEEVVDHADSSGISVNNFVAEHEFLIQAVKEEYNVAIPQDAEKLFIQQQVIDVNQAVSSNAHNSPKTTTATLAEVKGFHLRCPMADDDRSFECFSCRHIFKTELRCDKTFTDWSNLDKHRRIHVGDKKYSCDQPGCSKTFTVKCNMIEHKRIHSGGKPFICQICNKSMRHGSTFRKHQNIHLKVKPYACGHDGCNKSFSRRYRLKEHSYTHSVDINCNRKYNDKASLEKHALTHHVKHEQ